MNIKKLVSDFSAVNAGKQGMTLALGAMFAVVTLGISVGLRSRPIKNPEDDKLPEAYGKIWTLEDIDFSKSFEVGESEGMVSTAAYLPGRGAFVNHSFTGKNMPPTRFGEGGMFLLFWGRSKEELQAMPVADIRRTVVIKSLSCEQMLKSRTLPDGQPINVPKPPECAVG